MIQCVAAEMKAKQLLLAGENLPQFMSKLLEGERSSAPAAQFVNKVQATEKAIAYGQKLGYSQDVIAATLKIIEEEGGCIERFALALEKLEGVPGVEKSMKMAFTTKKCRECTRGLF